MKTIRLIHEKTLRYKVLIYSLFFFLVLNSNCHKSIYIPDNELSILFLYYPEKSQLPTPAENYFLKIEQMKNSTPGDDVFHKYIYCDSIRTNEPFKLNSTNGLSYSRFIISAKKDTLSAVTELIYKGGTIQIDLFLK